MIDPADHIAMRASRLSLPEPGSLRNADRAARTPSRETARRFAGQHLKTDLAN